MERSDEAQWVRHTNGLWLPVEPFMVRAPRRRPTLPSVIRGD